MIFPWDLRISWNHCVLEVGRMYKKTTLNLPCFLFFLEYLLLIVAREMFGTRRHTRSDPLSSFFYFLLYSIHFLTPVDFEQLSKAHPPPSLAAAPDLLRMLSWEVFLIIVSQRVIKKLLLEYIRPVLQDWSHLGDISLLHCGLQMCPCQKARAWWHFFGPQF